MIKGIGKQIVLLTNTDSDIFEQAIFILRSGSKVSSQDVVKECERIMNSYIKSKKARPSHNWWKVGFFLLLAVAVVITIIYIVK